MPPVPKEVTRKGPPAWLALHGASGGHKFRLSDRGDRDREAFDSRMKRLLFALLLCSLSSCTLVYSSRRYAAEPGPLPAGFEVETGDRHLLLLQARPALLSSGGERIVRLRAGEPAGPLAFEAGVAEAYTGTYAFGPILPFIPIFGLDGEPAPPSVTLSLVGLDDAAPLLLDTREVRFLDPQTGESIGAEEVSGYLGRTPAEPGVLELGARDFIRLSFPLSQQADRIVFQLPVSSGVGEPVRVELPYRRLDAVSWAGLP